VALDERVGQSNFDERLSGDAEPTSLLVDLSQQIYGKVHVHTLDHPAGAHRLADVHVRRQIDTSDQSSDWARSTPTAGPWRPRQAWNGVIARVVRLTNHRN
jgi:hypothetical protein